MPVTAHTTVHRDESDGSVSPTSTRAQSHRSHMSGASTATGGKKIVRSLDTFDAKQKTGTLINSPRSLLACAKEGVDPDRDLAYKETKDFLLACKGDKEVAAIKRRHYMEIRAELLRMARARRDAIIAMTSNDAAPGNADGSTTDDAAGSSEQPPQRASTPAVKGSDQLTTSTKHDEFGTQRRASDSAAASQLPPRSQKSQSNLRGSKSLDQLAMFDADSFSDDSDDSVERRRRERAERNRILSPEEFRRREEEAKQLKVARQVEKMKRVMERNRKREEAQIEHMEQTRRRMKQQELERQHQLEREEVQRYLRERAARKRDAELAVQRDMKHQATLQRQEELRREREERARRLQEKEATRDAMREQQRREHEEEMERQREAQQQRLRAIFEQNEELLDMRRDDLEDRMAHADEKRRILEESRDAELEERKRRNAKRTAENEAKRRRAQQRYEARIGGYVDKATEAERRRQEREEQRRNYLELRRLQEEDEARHRREIKQDVDRRHEEEARRIEERLKEAEDRFRSTTSEKQHESKLRAVEKDIVVMDRVSHVQRMVRQQEQARVEAGEKFQQKMERVARLRAETAAMEEQRKRMQHDAVLQRRKPDMSLSATPGPGEYAAVEAEKKLLGLGPGVRMGAAPPKHRLDASADLPGPGQYGNPVQGIRKSRGPKLPPRHHTISPDRKRTPRRSRTAMSDRLPSLKHSSSNNGRSNTSMARSPPRDGRADDGRPAELRDEDFATDDEFDDA